MGRTEWTIRFLLRCFKHSKRRYYHHMSWHDYARKPEDVADNLVGFVYEE